MQQQLDGYHLLISAESHAVSPCCLPACARPVVAGAWYGPSQQEGLGSDRCRQEVEKKVSKGEQVALTHAVEGRIELNADERSSIELSVVFSRDLT